MYLRATIRQASPTNERGERRRIAEKLSRSAGFAQLPSLTNYFLKQIIDAT
jgi:hypothetical protein